MKTDNNPFPVIDEVYKGDIIDADAISPRSLREVTQYADRRGKQVIQKRIEMQAAAADAANCMEAHIAVVKAANEAASKYPEAQRAFDIIEEVAFRINVRILGSR